MTARVAGWVAAILRNAERARTFVGTLSAAELATDEVRLRIAIMNPAKRNFKYKVTLVKVTGVKQLPPVETEETLLSISEGL